MNICRVSQDDLKNLEPLFTAWEETLIWSCLQGCMGSAWTDSSQNPKSAQLVIADFCFLAGEVREELVRHRPKEHESDFVIMVPQNEAWAKQIEGVYGNYAVKVTRYAIKKEPDVFDLEKLQGIVEAVDKEYEIRLMDKELFEIARENRWSGDLCSQFLDFNDYAGRGLGVAALHKGELVSGASSYTVYHQGIEIEIDTREDYRRKGLALVCGAKLILECRARNLYPSWDAQNKGSVALAEKLGYHFKEEYTAYEVTMFGGMGEEE